MKQKKKLKIIFSKKFLLLDSVELSPLPFVAVVVVVVGQVERNSFVLFFIGNEKSFRGQQLISIIEIEKINVY
jgi:hypothetical protein